MPITTNTRVLGVYTTLSRAQWNKARVICIMKVKEKRKESESIVGLKNSGNQQGGGDRQQAFVCWEFAVHAHGTKHRNVYTHNPPTELDQGGPSAVADVHHQTSVWLVGTKCSFRARCDLQLSPSRPSRRPFDPERACRVEPKRRCS